MARSLVNFFPRTSSLAASSWLSAIRSRSSRATPALQTFRKFHASSPRLQDAAPVRKPVGAFRGGLFGFLLGSVLAGAGVYGYILEEYRVSNNLLTEDIYALQASVARTEAYVKALEEQVKSKK